VTPTRVQMRVRDARAVPPHARRRRRASGRCAHWPS
jgi:hypothetical protein